MTKPDRLTHRNRAMPARLVRVHPCPGLPFHVEVRIARNRRHMREEVRRVDGDGGDLGGDCMGMVRSYTESITGRDIVRPRGMVARMYLNAKDLQRKPGEIVSHECTHAGMAWARVRRADLSRMSGEEVLCYAVGRLVAQVNSALYACGVFR